MSQTSMSQTSMSQTSMSQTTSFSKELWQKNRWRWLAPLLVVVSMAGLLSVYRAVYAGRVAQLQNQFEEEAERLAALREERAEVEALVVRLRAMLHR